MKTGDAIASVAQPIAKGIDWILDTDLSNCGGCKTMRDNLNAGTPLWEALRDRFWLKQERENTMLFIINAQAEAETVEDALKSRDNWKVTAVNPRPEPRPQTANVTRLPQGGFPAGVPSHIQARIPGST